MFNKFDFLWGKLEVQDRSIEKSCHQKLKKLAWYIYLCSKPQLFDSQYDPSKLPEYALAIVAVLELMVKNLDKEEVTFTSAPNPTTLLLQHAFQTPNTPADFSTISQKLQEFVSLLVTSEQIEVIS